VKPIVHYFDGFYRSSGGVEAHIRDIAASTDDLAVVITDAFRGYAPIEELRPGFIVRHVGPQNTTVDAVPRFVNRRPLFPVRLASDVWRARRKLRLLDKLHPRLLHVHGLNMPASLIRLGFQRFPRFMDRIADGFDRIEAPRVATIHGLFSRMDPGHWTQLETSFYAQFDHLLCVDRSLVRFVEDRWAGDRVPCVHWFPNAVDTHFFVPSPMPVPDPIRIGFVGRLEKSRGLEELIYLSHHLPPNVELEIAGAGSYHDIEVFERRVGRQGVHLIYNADPRAVRDLLRSVHVLFNPVLVDGISRASLEALASGRPVTMLAGTDRDPVSDGTTGFVLDRSNDSIRAWADSLPSKVDELEALGREGRQRIELEFSLEAFGKRIREIYAHAEAGTS
jgi:glycosyltransferase involved in cell wall biosynthesis